MCTLYIFGTFGFAEKLNIQNCENSSGYCAHYICTECLDFQTNWIFRAAEIQWKIVHIIHVRNVWIRKKIECPLLGKCNKKLCMLYIYGMSGLAKKSNVQNCVNSTGNCVHYIYRISRYVGNLNIQNYENSIWNCLHYICTECLDLQKNWISRIAKIELEIVYIICTKFLD